MRDSAIKFKNGKMKNGFSIFSFPIKIRNWKLKNFYHFLIEIEIPKNVLVHSNFKMKIEWHFQCTDCFLSKLQYRNENQSYISKFIFQFIKKNEMALWVHGFRCFPVNFVKFPRTPFSIEHLWWLLLSFYSPVYFVRSSNCIENFQ